ncbi:MAG TPA: CusA/CzcA family heavy metal efflux RND transporter [Gammaproteobacteria bacterium]|nr:CusA/CzcA family heavy metal efflux RND transporter [Gammaproteobacteria bacterium]
MITKLIDWSIHNRVLVLLSAVFLCAWGVYAVARTPVDAIPDLSDTQVIIKTAYPGQSPQIVEDQVTYPIATRMLAVPGARVVRGYSFFGDSFVYIIFEDGTDLYWARSRVLEYLNQAGKSLPPDAAPALGPDATGVGWVYEYALVDRKNAHDLSELRSLQDWYLKYELQSLPGVAEVAAIGGMVKQYQVIVDPDRLRALNIPLQTVAAAIKAGNGETGGSVLEIAEAEYMVRSRGYLTSRTDIDMIPVAVSKQGTPVLLRDVATVQIGPEMRRGIAELDGQGEVAGGIIVMRSGGNPLDVIKSVKNKLEELQSGLPDGVEIVETYDRSPLIHRAIKNLIIKLFEEFLVVTFVCALFLRHWRSAWVAVVSLPLGILAAFIVMLYQGINANIMSLGGIAIAIGAMVDAAIVMIENAHKHLEHYRAKYGRAPEGGAHWALVARAAGEVGPALFFSLLIITLSFIPIFSLEAQEGRLFAPLAFTKTYAMAAAAGLAVTLVPVLMGYLISGPVPAESSSPLNRRLIEWYRPALQYLLQRPRATLGWALGIGLLLLLPYSLLGSEFMPELQEGDLLYMPSALPGLSIGKARQLLQQTDRLIAGTPEVKRVFGKIGRAETATDPAPLEMVETIVQLKPRNEWRSGMTPEKLIREMNAKVALPGITNVWVQPIKTRIDMLATGIRTPVGIKIAGDDLDTIQQIGLDIEAVLRGLPATAAVYSERVVDGRYIDIVPDRLQAARFGLNIGDINTVIGSAVGGMNITNTIEGRARYPVNIRYPRDTRDHIEALENLPLITPTGAHVTLSRVAAITIAQGPPMIRTEDARLNGWVYVDIRDSDLGGYIADAKAALAAQIKLPPGYTLSWTGQFEYLQRAAQRLRLIVPLTLLITFLLLYLIFRDGAQAALVMLTLPFALGGGISFLWLLGYHLSVAVAVGLIALAGVAAEFGVVMLVYLNNAVRQRREAGQLNSAEDLRAAIMEGAVQRVRPKAMTVAVILAGLLPIMLGGGTGSEVMRRIAAPMIGGMISAPVISLFLLPLGYALLKSRDTKSRG